MQGGETHEAGAEAEAEAGEGPRGWAGSASGSGSVVSGCATLEAQLEEQRAHGAVHVSVFLTFPPSCGKLRRSDPAGAGFHHQTLTGAQRFSV